MLQYKALVIEYSPKAKKMAMEIEQKANEMAQTGWTLATCSVTNSAKAIMVFQKPCETEKIDETNADVE